MQNRSLKHINHSQYNRNTIISHSVFFQPKLTINQPNDAYEVEADAMADKVMRMNMPSNAVQLMPLPISSVQRKCAHCEEEQKMQRKEMNSSETTADAGLESYVGDLNSGGQALSLEARSFYEPRFGYDFSNVKIHTDTVAAKSAQSINALAYTSGNNIVFNSGQYAPNTESGKRLLGHELTHVVQQQTQTIQPYRKTPKQDKTKDERYSFNFGLLDTTTLIEDSFNLKKDKETKPWIQLITVTLDTQKKDANGILTWFGNAHVQYFDNPVKWSDFDFTVTAGSETLGKSTASRSAFTVTRIEGVGYNSGKFSGEVDKANREGPRKRYSKDLSANMSYAVFYNGGEALHEGPLDWSSHGCLHVDWGVSDLMKQINYHSVIGLTKVKVSYV